MATDRLPDALRPILALQRADIHTSLPAAIVDYDPGTQTATIEIGLREILEAQDDDDPDQVATYPRLSGVPVAFPSAGGYHLTFPLPAGSTGDLVCTEGDLSRWLETGQVSDPGISTRHGLGGFFVPGLRHSRNRLSTRPDALSLGIDGGITLVIDDSSARVSGRLEVDGNTESAALASKTDEQINDLRAAIAGWTPISNDGGAALKIALSSWLGDVSATASAKIKSGG